MEWLAASFVLVCTAVAGYCAYRSQLALQAAEAHAERLRVAVTNVVALEASMVALTASHRKLAGQFHASKRWQDHERGQGTEPRAVDRDELRRQYLPTINGG